MRRVSALSPPASRGEHSLFSTRHSVGSRRHQKNISILTDSCGSSATYLMHIYLDGCGRCSNQHEIQQSSALSRMTDWVYPGEEQHKDSMFTLSCWAVTVKTTKMLSSVTKIIMTILSHDFFSNINTKLVPLYSSSWVLLNESKFDSWVIYWFPK